MSETPLSPADHFTAVASAYARYRPHYPDALFEYLATLPARRALAWDCGAGSGQATAALARYFSRVVATDVSMRQLAAAPPHAQIACCVATAEASCLAAGRVDLIAVAQALHWFDLDAFYAEVTRVLARGGVLAAWSYGNVQLGDARLDDVVGSFYHDTIGAFWPPERCHVEQGYRDLAFPFTELVPPLLRMEAHWTLAELLGYIRSWSAVGRFRVARGEDPVLVLEQQLAPLWGPPGALRHIVWPLLLRVGHEARPGRG